MGMNHAMKPGARSNDHHKNKIKNKAQGLKAKGTGGPQGRIEGHWRKALELGSVSI
jgi:hypothetical protein